MFIAITFGVFSLLMPGGTSSHAEPANNILIAQAQGQSQTPDSKQVSPDQQTQTKNPAASPAASVPNQTLTQSSATPASSNDNTSKLSSKKKVHAKKQAAKAGVSTTQGAGKVVVHNGGTAEPRVQLSPRVSDDQTSHERANTEGLLATTDSNLKQVAGRQLNPSQQETLTQIRSYMQQAKKASAAGDMGRAHNLAFKARLLSDDLVSH
jgi:hypothetical protein